MWDLAPSRRTDPREDAVWSPFVVLGMGGPAAVALLLAVAVAGGGTLVSHNLMDPQDRPACHAVVLHTCRKSTRLGVDLSPLQLDAPPFARRRLAWQPYLVAHRPSHLVVYVCGATTNKKKR